MKFRYKVLCINLILLSLSLGTVGYMMVNRNFEIAKEAGLQNAVLENNMVQYSVEYELLSVIGGGGVQIENSLKDIGATVSDSMPSTDSDFYLRYNNRYAYSSNGMEAQVPRELYLNTNQGQKNYMISSTEEGKYIYVSSCSIVDEKTLFIINRYDASEAYELMESQVRYFRLVLAGVLLFASVIMYLVSIYLTRPLETLNVVTDEIARGNYAVRSHVKSRDEVGNLSIKFNGMAQAVEEHVDKLNDMIHRRDQFVADFTHEIKTPMTTIIGYADTMRSMELPREDQIMGLNYIFSEGKRLEVMSGKLFELIYLRQHSIERTPIHITDMEKEIRRITEPMLAKKNIRLVTDMENGMISGSKELLVTVFVNLIDNARKASREGTKVCIKGRQIRTAEAESYEISVIDHGMGMSRETVKHICDEFYMADKSRARQEGGAGIGMSLVALILEQHQAELSIHSSIGRGTQIRIRFKAEGTGCETERDAT